MEQALSRHNFQHKLAVNWLFPDSQRHNQSTICRLSGKKKRIASGKGDEAIANSNEMNDRDSNGSGGSID